MTIGFGTTGIYLEKFLYLLKLEIAKWPEGLYLLTGSLLQYEIKFNPLIDCGAMYSIESGEIHLPISGL